MTYEPHPHWAKGESSQPWCVEVNLDNCFELLDLISANFSYRTKRTPQLGFQPLTFCLVDECSTTM